MKFPAHRRGLLRLAASVLLTFLATVRAAGQSSSDQDLLSLNIEDLTRLKVYSASRHMEGVREAPSPVSIITAEDIQRYGWRTLGEALRSLRGFYTAYDRQYTYLGVRGVMRPGDYNSRILLLINGERVNENVYSSAPVGTEFPLDLDLIDHIEVVRGPGSSLFGTNAVFGVINVITRRPTGESAIEVSTDTASFLERSGRVTGMVNRGRLAGLFSASFYRNPGSASLFFPEYATPATNNGFAENSDGDQLVHAFSELGYGNLRLQAFYSSRMKILPTASFGTAFNDPTTRETDDYGQVAVDYRRNIASGTDLDLRAYHDGYRYGGTFAVGDGNPRIESCI